MPLITETYYLSLTQDNRGILRLRCSQDDTLRTVNLKLYNNGSIFVIPSGVSASISGVKQNGAVFSKPCTISQNRDSVVLQLSSDITNVDGIIVAEIVLNDGGGGRLGTSNFIIQVEKNPIRAGVVQDTETPIEYINDFIEKIQTLTARLNNLITPSGDPSLAEVVDARISSLDGNTYQNLKARVDADITTLNTGKANKSEVYTKSQIDGLLENVEIDVDDELSDESENPVQNKVINRKISEIKADLDDIVPGLSSSAKEALLACFTHVGWTDENGQDYYDALAAALETDIRQLPDAYTWLYDATEGDLLSEQNYVTVSSSGTYTETIINGQLVLNSQPIEEGAAGNFIRFSLSDDTSINARLSARVKFNDIPRTREGTPGAEGFRMQLSNGTNGAQVFFISQPMDNDNLGVSYFEGTNKRYVDLPDYDMSKYHIVEIKLANGAQTMYIDGDVIFTSNTLSSNYCTANAILNQRSGSSDHGTVTTIDWIAYNEVS